MDVAHSITESGREPRFSDLTKFVDERARISSSMFGLDFVRENNPRSHTENRNILIDMQYLMNLIGVLRAKLLR